MIAEVDPQDIGRVRAFLAAYDARELPIPPGSEDLVAEFVGLARLLESDAAVHTLDGRLRLGQVLQAIGALPPWLRQPTARMREFEQHRPRTPNERRHRRAVAAGRSAAVGWLGHPATRREIEAARPHLTDVAAPLWLHDQQTLVQVVALLLDTIAFYPDGTTWPDPIGNATLEFRTRFEKIRGPYVSALGGLADRIALGGAPIDPEDLGVLLVLAQLVHLDIDWEREAPAIADELIIWPPGWIDLDEARTGHLGLHASRHGRASQVTRDLAEAGEAIVGRVGRDRLSPPYAGGRQRKRPRVEHRMRDRERAVGRVLRRFPDATAGAMRRTWAAGPDTPGGMLRIELDLQPHDRAPGESTLRLDILAIQIGSRQPVTRHQRPTAER